LFEHAVCLPNPKSPRNPRIFFRDVILYLIGSGVRLIRLFVQADSGFALIRSINKPVQAMLLSNFVNHSNWMRGGPVFQSTDFRPVPQIHRNERLIVQPSMAVDEPGCFVQ
jgi:hypothetical protein